MSDIYNLQVKISTELEKKLRVLAKKDRRKLSSYVRVVLEDLCEDVEIEQTVNKIEKHQMIDKEKVDKKQTIPNPVQKMPNKVTIGKGLPLK